jgi:hypothetical protein
MDTYRNGSKWVPKNGMLCDSYKTQPKSIDPFVSMFHPYCNTYNIYPNYTTLSWFIPVMFFFMRLSPVYATFGFRLSCTQ